MQWTDMASENGGWLLLVALTFGCGSAQKPYALDVGSDDGGSAIAFGPGSASAPAAFDAHIEDDRVMVTFVTLSCAGACATVQAVGTGGYPPYTYAWDDGSTNPTRHICPASDASYSVKVTDQGTSGELARPAETVQVPLTANFLACRDAGTPDASAEASSGDGGCSTGASLIVNGSFEDPVVPVGNYSTFATGSSFAGWNVIGDASGNVSVLSGTYGMLPGVMLPPGASWSPAWTPECGAQTLDLTGVSNTATGVSHTLATTAGTTYTLTFWVGNVVDPGVGWGTSSTVDVLIDGVQVLVAANSDGNATALTWKQFTVRFAATAASTTIAFVNGDPSTDNANILDGVVLY